MSISFQGVCFFYNKKKYPFNLINLNFELQEDEKVCIHGRTGEGKTTLFKLLFREVSPQKGNILVDTTLLAKEKSLHDKIVFIFQSPVDQFLFPSIKDEFLFYTNTTDGDDILQNIRELSDLFKVNVDDYFQRDMYSISHGEMRILQLILHLSRPSEYTILDEPATFLDLDIQDQFISYLDKIHNKGILIFTKYPEIYTSVVDRSVHLETLHS